MNPPDIRGVNHPCYVADTLLEGVGGRVAAAVANESVLAEISPTLPESLGSLFTFNFKELPDGLVAEAEQYILDKNGCDFVTTGQCPLVGFLVDKIMEEY